MKKFTLLLFALIIGLSKINAQVTPKYVFLFIGDGMGLNQVFLTKRYLEYFKSDSLIFLNPMWKFGLQQTDCTDSLKITDSGAGATAIACGEKTSFGAIGVDIHAQPLQSIAEYLHKKNFKIGILTSVPLNHATPACFYGHEPTRRNYDNIINELMASHFDYFAGGGFMLGNADTSKRIYKNFIQVADALKKNNFNLIFNTTLLEKNPKVALLPAVVIDTMIRNKQQKLNTYNDEKNSLPFVIDEPGYKGKLALYVKTAINSLENDTGFFMMVEGGQIDFACHDNDAATAVNELIAFNDAIKVAYEFYKKYPQQTLIIVTADHETGGLTLGVGYDEHSKSPNAYALFPYKLALQKKSLMFSDTATIKKINTDAQIGWTSDEHTGSPVGIWAIGPGSEKFLGIYENSDIKKKILDAMKQ